MQIQDGHRHLTLKSCTLRADWSIEITKPNHQNRFQPIEIEISRFVICCVLLLSTTNLEVSPMDSTAVIQTAVET
jgi:hypothetical protein